MGFSNIIGQETPALYAVMFHADNCSKSQAIAPKVKELQSKLEGQMEFVKFDFSTGESIQKTQDLANKGGLMDVLAANKGTGFIVLVDAETKEKKAILSAEQSTNEMLDIIKNNL